MHGSAQRYNLVFKAIIEICEIHYGEVGEKALFDACVEADAFFRINSGLLVKASSKPSGVRMPVPKLP